MLKDVIVVSIFKIRGGAGSRKGFEKVMEFKDWLH
jgi:hypothetical protein